MLGNAGGETWREEELWKESSVVLKEDEARRKS